MVQIQPVATENRLVWTVCIIRSLRFRRLEKASRRWKQRDRRSPPWRSPFRFGSSSHPLSTIGGPMSVKQFVALFSALLLGCALLPVSSFAQLSFQPSQITFHANMSSSPMATSIMTAVKTWWPWMTPASSAPTTCISRTETAPIERRSSCPHWSRPSGTSMATASSTLQPQICQQHG